MKIKLGIIGFGGMGKWHAENAPRAGVEIAAVCDIEEENRNCSHPMFHRHLQLWTKCLRRRISKITSPNQCQSRTSGADKTFGRTKSVPYAGTAYDESQFRTTD